MPGPPVGNLEPFTPSHCSVCGAPIPKVEIPSASVSKLLAEAARYCESYDWLTASDFEEKALEQLASHESLEAARIHELLGGSYFNGAFQSENREEFKQKIRRAEQHYGKAKPTYESLGLPALAQRAEARQHFAEFWHSDNFTERKLQIEKCVSLAKNAASSFDRREQQSSIDRTWLDLLTYVVEKFVYLPDRQSLVAHYKEAVRTADDAVSHLERAGESEELLEAIYLSLWTLSYAAGFVLSPGTFERSRQKREQLASRALQLSEKIHTPHSACIAALVAFVEADMFHGDYRKALKFLEPGIGASQKVRNTRIQALLFGLTAATQGIAATNEEDLQSRRKLLERAFDFGLSSTLKMKISLDYLYLQVLYQWYARLQISAAACETEPEGKIAMLKKAIETASNGVTYELSPILKRASPVLGLATYYLARITRDPREKTNLLKTGLHVFQKTVSYSEKIHPQSWYKGIELSSLARVEMELSTLAMGGKAQVDHLRAANSHINRALKISQKWASLETKLTTNYKQSLAENYELYADILVRLFRLDRERDDLDTAIKNYNQAILWLGKMKLVGPVAELQWKVAEAHNESADYNAACASYTMAQETYRIAARKVPTGAAEFHELARYMAAQARITDARRFHSNEEFASAARSYRDASAVLGQSERWRALAQHCEACSSFETSELESTNERPDKAKIGFLSAAQEFRAIARELKNRTSEAPRLERKLDPDDWIQANDYMAKYSEARARIEEARILDREDSGNRSSEKYLLAHESLNALRTQLTNREPNELEALALFCKGYSLMMKAGAESSARYYRDAAAQFTKAKALTHRRKYRLVGEANSSLCKGLGSGIRQRLTHDEKLYSVTKNHMQTAIDYYHEAGFDKTAKWADATRRMFDALFYLASAESTANPKRKAGLYRLSTKHLELAARIYKKLGFHGRRKMILKHLEKARTETGLLAAAAEVSRATPSKMPVPALSPPTNQDISPKGIGNPNVIGKLEIDHDGPGPWSVTTYHVKLVNVGLSAAYLARLESIAPEGFEVKNGATGLNTSEADLKGKILRPMEEHSFSVSLRPLRPGAFELRPVIWFSNDQGNLSSFEFQTVPLRVGETISVPISPALNYLAKAFVDDYMKKKLSLPDAGWRTLTTISKTVKIPRSQVYGDPRYGHTFGKSLEALVSSGVVEYRIVPGARGRGGNIMNVRIAYEREPVRKLVNEMVWKPLHHEAEVGNLIERSRL